YPDEAHASLAADQLQQTAIAQPALIVREYAMGKLWRHWGVHPKAMIGHSIGEYVAACLAGVMSLEDALSLVVARGRLMQQLPSGAMLAVPLPEREANDLLGGQLSVAAINGPSSCVIAGPPEAVGELEHRLAQRGLVTRRLRNSRAFHSLMMQPIVESFTKQVRKVQLHAPKIPYISNVTGTWIAPEQATDPDYWSKHLRQTVRFADGIAELLKDTERVLLEVGPGQELNGLAKTQVDQSGRQIVLSSLRGHDGQT